MNFKHLKSAIAASIIAISLTSCGGGGGGSSSPTAPPSGGGSTPTPPANGGIPSLFEASFEENGSFASYVFQDFTVNAPGNEEPQNLALVGADAAPFTVSFSITQPDSNGDRTVTTTLTTSTVFNYEDPQDANADNLYEFQLTGRFQNADLRSDFKVSIIDLDDDAETSAFSILGETALQTFGVPFMEIPDVDGDGNPELAVTNVTGKGETSGYIIDSEFINSVTGDIAVGAGTASGSRFTTSNNTGNFIPNALTGLPQADGDGTDILLVSDSNIYLFPIDTQADYNALEGNIDPASADRIHYALTSPDGLVNAKLIPDVNGDGLNDIAVILLGGNDGVGEAGIIYGVDTSGSPKTIANGFDITFQGSSEFGAFNRREVSELLPIPDIDGDGVGDLIISQRNFSNESIYFLKSGALATASTTIIDLDNLDLATQGFKVRGTSIDTVSPGQDYDGDGIPTLLFFDGRNDIHIIDGDEFAAINPATSTRYFGNNSSILTRSGGQGSSFGAMVDDMNGDGNQEFLGVSRWRGAVYVIDGTVILDTLNNPGTVNTLPQDGEFDIDLSAFFASNSDVAYTPVHLQNLDLFVLGWATDSNPQTETDPGRIVFFDAGVVREAFSSGATGVTIKR